MEDVMAKDKKTWIGAPPEKCDITGEPINGTFIDGCTVFNGSWAIMCPKCHEKYGTGLGEGKGQKYEKQGNDYVKVEG
jgi:hypothetical protein